jgi:hypothetical protein
MVSGIPIGTIRERNLSDMQPELNPVTEKKDVTPRKRVNSDTIYVIELNQKDGC